MTRPRVRSAHLARGVFLIEIAVALVVMGMMAAALFPLLAAASRKEADNADRAALTQARDALLAYAVRNGGFPAPLALLTENGARLSRTSLAAESAGVPATVTASQAPYGALPSALLGLPRTSSKGTLFQYDVHPALRADQPFDLSTSDMSAGGLATVHAGERNPQGTGQSVGQLCRNVHTLIDMERRVQLQPAVDGANYRLNLPRAWQPGFESLFNWTGSLFRAVDSAVVNDTWALSHSSAQAFMVTRPQPLAQARLDRANTVFSGDSPLDPAARLEVGYRIYEHPMAATQDAVNDDVRDYGGASTGVTLVELLGALQTAGQCTQGGDRCLNTEVQITVDNGITGQRQVLSVPTGPVLNLPLYWAVNPVSAVAAIAQSVTMPAALSALPHGTVSALGSRAACMPVLDSRQFSTLPPTRLDVYTVLPDSSYWLISSLPLQGVGALPATVLDSGRSHAGALKCYAPSPIKFESKDGSGAAPYEIKSGGAAGVTCSITSD